MSTVAGGFCAALAHAASAGTDANPSGVVHGSIIDPPKLASIRPTGTFASRWILRPKKYAAAENFVSSRLAGPHVTHAPLKSRAISIALRPRGTRKSRIWG